MMIYKHKYLPDTFTKNKEKISLKITKQQPFVIVQSSKFTFLNEFIQGILKIKGVYFEIVETDQCQVMGYQLPAVAFKNNFLSGLTLLEFLSDLFLQDQESESHFQERKSNLKRMYTNWLPIIKQSHEGFVNFVHLKQIGIYNEQDLHNHLFNQLFLIDSYVNQDVLKKKYPQFSLNGICVENMMAYQIVKTVLSLCGQSKADYILRTSFEKLIIFSEKFAQKLRRQLEVVRGEQQDKQIILDKRFIVKFEQDNEYPLKSWNWKRFAIIFCITGFIYKKWVQ